MSTNNTWNNNVSAANGITLNSGTGALNISTDASATTVSFGTGAAVKAVTIGSTNTTSATTVQSGSGALNVTATGGALTVNSGTGALSISNDASATTVAIATGGAAKVVTLGSTNGASSLALKCGTGDFSLASLTGNIMVAQDTGEINYPLQPAFLANKDVSQDDCTGNNTTVTVSYTSEIFDQNGDYNAVTSTFTAPVAGKYMFEANLYARALSTTLITMDQRIVTTLRSYWCARYDTTSYPLTDCLCSGSVIADMDAADTAYITFRVNGMGADTVDLPYSVLVYFCGYLCC